MRFFILVLLGLLFSCDNDNQLYHLRFSLNLINDTCVYESKDKYSAFTSIIDYKGDTYIAFREGKSHIPQDKTEYGKVVILKEVRGVFLPIWILQSENMDLRDPFFIIHEGRLRIYCGFNQFFDNNKYDHAGTAYSELSKSGWDDIKIVRHDVEHVVWIWKIRKYKDLYYGIGYLEGEYPILLNSKDGINWTSLSTLKLDGIYTEADFCFLNDSIFVCIRRDIPLGSVSKWGVSLFPFVDFSWKEMNVSIESPEMYCDPVSNQIWLAGREWKKNGDFQNASISVFEISQDGKTNRCETFSFNDYGDMGYPSFLYKDGILYMTYYVSNSSKSQIRMMRFFKTRLDGEK